MAAQKQKNSDPDLLGRLWINMVLVWHLMMDRRVGGMIKLIPVITVAYILSPIDFIPDFLLPFGVVDDITALLLGMQLFIRNAPPNVVNEYRLPRSKRKPQVEQDNNAPKVIEGLYEVKDTKKS